MSDWWARQLGGAVAPQQAPVQPQQPAGYPQKAVRWQPTYPPTGPRGQEVAGNGDQPEGEPDDNWHKVNRQGYVTKAPPSIGKIGACPECGGSNYFRRRWANQEAAPICVDCGYNGDLFLQSGTLLNAVGAKSVGPTQTARSDNPRAESHLWTDPGVGSDFSWGNVR